MADVVIQRVVFSLDRNVASLYYRLRGDSRPAASPASAPLDRRSMILGQGAHLETNTYFNGFFEAYWRRHTALGKLTLRLRLSGAGAVRLWRASTQCGVREIGFVEFDGENQTVDVEVPKPRAHSCEFGMLSFDVIASSDSKIISADWMAIDAEPKPVKLVAGYCTFNREKLLLDNIKTLADDSDLTRYLSRIVVVDQGTSKLKDHPDYHTLPPCAVSNTSFFEQANFGGTGGFARCMLEAMRLHDSTHVLLLDDDAIVESESVFRAAAFFSLAKQEFALGGAMLDLLQPTKMYEAGGFLLPEYMGVDGRGRNLSLTSPHNVLSFADPQYSHYSAWWFFACPLSIVKRCGLPLPLFINCDDVEYGCRLMREGIPTIILPGVGVWHLPFYLKTRSWVDYYSHRNMLAGIALHFPLPRTALAAILLRVLLQRLLTLDYFKAWALCEGLEDFLTGPSVLKENPERIHKRVLEFHRRLSPASLPKTACLRIVPSPWVPKSHLHKKLAFIRTLLWQLFRPSPKQNALPSSAMRSKGERWYVLRRADVVVLNNRYSDSFVVLRRNRALFLGFLFRGLRLTLRLFFSHKRVAEQWRDELKTLTAPPFWYDYLGMAAAEESEVQPERSAKE